jgi:hypothetical protein
MLVTALVALMSIALGTAVESTKSADDYLAAVGRASEKGQRLTGKIANLVSSSRHLYEDDATGRSYLAACDLVRFPPAFDARLPIIEEEHDLGPDAPDLSATGNILLLVTETTGSICVADKDTGKQRVIDTYRIAAVYPHQSLRVLLTGEPAARDLVLWRSQAFPSVQQLREIADKDERESVVKDLNKRYGFTYAWDPLLPVEEALFKIDNKGQIASGPTVGLKIREQPALSEGPRLLFAQIQLARTDPGRTPRKAVLSVESPTAWSPHGFELKVAGPSGARKVWLHLTLEAAAAGGRESAFQSCTTIAHMRDF